MSRLTETAMRGYLSRSIASFNDNKLNGILAEVDFRRYIADCGFAERVSVGGWIARSVGAGSFGHHTAAFFPDTVLPGQDYSPARTIPSPSRSLLTISAILHQVGIRCYHCVPDVSTPDPEQMTWRAAQLGLPSDEPYVPFPVTTDLFPRKAHRYQFLRYHQDIGRMPAEAVPDQFSKEHLRIAFASIYNAEVSDIDGVLWGQRHVYPLEIKEKTPANDRQLGDFFGLDIGPFVKLAYYAAKYGNMHSLFVVREIDNRESRGLVGWWFITFNKLAQYASWVFQAGGPNMQGGRSAVVRVPKVEFTPLNAQTLAGLE
jgi:hypothetical protein